MAPRKKVPMICEQLKSISPAEILTLLPIVERIELETPQIIYLVFCEVCDCTHSLEFSAIEGEPPLPGESHKAYGLKRCGYRAP
jgi:hypothetical protein